MVATAVVNPRRSVSETLPMGGGGGGAVGVRESPISMPTQPSMEKKKNETEPQNSPLRLTLTPPSSHTVATIEPRADTDTTTRLSSPLTKMPPFSRNGLVPKPTRIFADASSLIGPADHLISQPAPKPTENPSKLNCGSLPSRWS